MVDVAHRLVLPAFVVEGVDWFQLTTRECLAVPGLDGELQLYPAGLRAHLEAAAAAITLPSGSDPGATYPELDVLRELAMIWTLEIDSNRHRITLPLEARHQGLVPSAGGTAAVFGAGGVLEIWTVERWEQVRRQRRPTVLQAIWR